MLATPARPVRPARRLGPVVPTALAHRACRRTLTHDSRSAVAVAWGAPGVGTTPSGRQRRAPTRAGVLVGSRGVIVLRAAIRSTQR